MDNPQAFLISSPSVPIHPDPDGPDSWVMLDRSGFVKIEGEKILLRLDSSISCDLSVPQELKAQCPPFRLKSNKGTLFLTTKRIVYLPSKRRQEFESFSAPILNFQGSSTSSYFLWGWAWKAHCKPVPGGNIPRDLGMIEVNFTFSNGGMTEFDDTFTRLRENLSRYEELRREMGPGPDIPDEPLPAYEGPGANPPESTTTLTVPRTNRSDGSSSRRAPDEPPPGYDEAQAQQISMRLEDHIRGEVDRGATDE